MDRSTSTAQPTTHQFFKVHGMHCASCAILINKTLTNLKGVKSAQANYGTERLALEYDPSLVSLEKVEEIVKKLGYSLILPKEGAKEEEIAEQERAKNIRSLRNRVILSFVLASPIIGYYMATHMFNLTHIHALCFGPGGLAEIFGGKTGCAGGNLLDLNWIYWIMTTPIQFGVGWPFYRNAWTALRVGSSSMDVLVVLGTTSAYLISTIGFMFSDIGFLNRIWEGFDHPFWESSAALMSFIILGRYFEALSKGKVSEAIRKLIGLTPDKALVLKDGKEVEMAVADLQVGDTFLVKPGSRVPTDGVILEGESSIDEKVVTGESMPVGKNLGEEVIGATVNTYGLLKCRATKVGKDTLLHQIVRLVEEAQATRAPIQNVADRISERFVPTVVIFAILTAAAWYFVGNLTFIPALLFAIAVLVVSCPCALGLATPTALMVGTARGAESGILIKGGEALEKARSITAVAFDKTGTLTKGEPAVTDTVALGDIPQREVLRLAAIAERGSEHPLAGAVVKAMENTPVPEPQNFKNISGKGIQADFEGKTILVGNEELMHDNGLNPTPYAAQSGTLQDQAKTVVYVAYNGKIIGLLALADTLKEYAKETITELKRRGKQIILITGDNEKTAKAIAGMLGIDLYYAKVLPQKKEMLIDTLQKQGKVVAMIGDGINDAPALAKSNLGIAVGSGTDVAIETGEIILIKDDLRDIVTAIDLSQKTLNKIWQNFFWAFSYNVVAIPIAAGLHLLVTQSGGEPLGWIVTVSEGLRAIPAIGNTIGSLFFSFSQSALRPEIAGFAMAFSSVSVVANSLLLRRYKEPAFARQEAKK